jgi:hypothetical protein
VLRQKLEMTMPNWRDALNELEQELAAHPQPEAPIHKPEPVAAAGQSAPAAEAASKAAQTPAKDKPARERPAKQKPATAKKVAKKSA